MNVILLKIKLHKISIIGYLKKLELLVFSTTPEYMRPLTNVISKYSIYDGFLDKVILPPKNYLVEK